MNVVVAGCGYGGSVKKFRDRGHEAYGFDVSTDALSKSPVPEYVTVSDVRDPGVLSHVRSTYGLSNIDLVVTEKLLSCLEPHEARAACRRLRREADLEHYVMPKHVINPGHHTRLTLEEWTELCDPNGHDEWYDAMTTSCDPETALD